jgi:hypothetical protein
MTNDEHVALLNKGVAAWNKWREENRNMRRRQPKLARSAGASPAQVRP